MLIAAIAGAWTARMSKVFWALISPKTRVRASGWIMTVPITREGIPNAMIRKGASAPNVMSARAGR
jgi:hypothetical protein